MNKGRILIVDDDEDLCAQLAEALEDDSFTVEHTSDPLMARQLIQEFLFNIVILDYKMPGTTGVDLLRTIKEKSLSTKVFIVSGRPFIEKILLDENVAHLITEVIPKPFDVGVLFEKLKVLNA